MLALFMFGFACSMKEPTRQRIYKKVLSFRTSPEKVSTAWWNGAFPEALLRAKALM